MILDRVRAARRSVVLVVLVIALVTAVFVTRQVDDDSTSGTDTPTPTDSATPAAEPASPDDFCVAFRAFADAYGGYVAVNDDTSGAAVVAAAEELVGLGRPLGLSMGGWLSLLDLVNGVLLDIEGDATHPAPEDAGDAKPDVAARDAYLGTACPA